MNSMKSDVARPPVGATSMMFWNRTVEQAVAAASVVGFDAIEIWAEHLWRDNEDPEVVARALARAGIKCTVHCPIMDVNIASPNYGIREVSLQQNIESVELAAALGAELIVIHPGALYSRRNAREEFWSWQVDALGQIIAAAEALDVCIAFENMDVHAKKEVVTQPEDLARALASFSYDKLGITYDTTHRITTEANLEFIAKVDNIIHVHLADASTGPDGSIRTHLPLGEGNLDFRAMLRALLPKFRGILSLETFIPASDDLSLVVQEREKVLALLDEACGIEV